MTPASHRERRNAATATVSAGRGRKPISEFKVIQNIAPLIEDKAKFRELSRKSVNAMGQVEGKYETALTMMMKLADALEIYHFDRFLYVFLSIFLLYAIKFAVVQKIQYWFLKRLLACIHLYTK